MWRSLIPAIIALAVSFGTAAVKETIFIASADQQVSAGGGDGCSPTKPDDSQPVGNSGGCHDSGVPTSISSDLSMLSVVAAFETEQAEITVGQTVQATFRVSNQTSDDVNYTGFMRYAGDALAGSIDFPLFTRDVAGREDIEIPYTAFSSEGQRSVWSNGEVRGRETLTFRVNLTPVMPGELTIQAALLPVSMYRLQTDAISSSRIIRVRAAD